MKLLPQFRDNRFEYWAQMKAQEAHFERLRAAGPVIELYEPIPRDFRHLWFEWKYNPDQPRVPRGNPRGGQWTRDGHGGGEAGEEAEADETGLEAGPDDSGFYENEWDFSPSSADEDPSYDDSESLSQDRGGQDDGEDTGHQPYGEAPDGTPVEEAYTRGTNTREREPFVTPDGQPVLNQDGNPMMMASDHPPEFFVQKGEEARADIQAAKAGAAFARLFNDLYNFRHGGDWDLQRTPGVFDDALRDYSTVAIGLYASAAGLSESTILELQNQFARFRSRFDRSEEMDEYYRYLPRKNSWNTRLGYNLYRLYYRR